MNKIELPTWPQFEEDEINAAIKVLRSGKVNTWTGDEVRLFEKEFSDFIGMPYAVAVCNGSIALELALHALEIGQGDDVVVPSKSFVATASSVVIRGARPVFADIDPESQNMTVDTIKAVVTENTRAIILVHLGGWPCEIDLICEFAKSKNIKLIEDCAQAHGAKYKNSYVGSFGDASAFSFCQDKIMTMGEGGLLLLKDESAWQRAWSYKDHGKDHDTVFNQNHAAGFRWVHQTFGTNWRLTEMQAAIGRKQLEKLPVWLNQRSNNSMLLIKELTNINGLRMYHPPDHVQNAWYRCYAFVELEKLQAGWDRDRIIEAINAKGIPCLEGGCSEIYKEKAFVNAGLTPLTPLPVAEKLGRESICFLVHPTLDESDMKKISNGIKEVMHEAVM